MWRKPMSKIYTCNWCSSIVENPEITLKQAGDRMFMHAYGDCPKCKEHKYRKTSHIMRPVNEEASAHISDMKKKLYSEHKKEEQC